MSFYNGLWLKFILILFESSVYSGFLSLSIVLSSNCIYFILNSRFMSLSVFFFIFLIGDSLDTLHLKGVYMIDPSKAGFFLYNSTPTCVGYTLT